MSDHIKFVDGIAFPMDADEVDEFEAGRAPASPTQGDLLNYAADKRWQVETGGIAVLGVPVHTDDRSKLMILGARMEAMANPFVTKSWVGADGNVYPLDAASIIVIADAVAAHVTLCFECFAGVRGAIIAGETTTREQIDAAFASPP